MKTKRIISLLLAILMILSVFSLVSCSKEESAGKTDEDVEVISETENKDDKLSVYDQEVKNLNGHEFWFLVQTTEHTHLNTNEIYAEEQNGDKVNDAVYKRNSSLEKTYNCKIFEERVTSPTTSIREQLIAGEYQYDFIYDKVLSLYGLTAAGLLCDLNALENIQLEKSWWDQSASKGLSIEGKLFYGIGDAGTMDDRAAWIMIFSKDLVKKNKTDDPYALVKSGDWTIDKMYEIMCACVEDKDGDGVYTVGKDIMGYTGERLNSWMHVAACNAPLGNIASDGSISIDITVNDRVLEAWTAIKPMFTSPYHDVSDSGMNFRNGLCAFYGINCGALLNFANTSVDFGVVPFPKLNKDQTEYWTSVDHSWFCGYSIPSTCDQADDANANGFTNGQEQAAYFLNAFGYYSQSTLTIAFYEQVIKRQIVKDNDSQDMIGLALKNKLYDPVMLFNIGKYSTLFTECACPAQGNGQTGDATNWDNLVSTYESRVDSARKSLKSYVEYINSEIA